MKRLPLCFMSASARSSGTRNGQNFGKPMEAGKAEGRVSTRRQLFKLAEGGNVAATIFLAKNLLGYRNAVEFRAPDPGQDDVKKAMDDLRALYGLNSEPTSGSTDTDR